MLSLGRAIGVLGSLAGTGVALADEPAYRAVAGAPIAWQTFARDVQARFEQRLAADDKDARAFQDKIAKRRRSSDVASLKFTVRTWVTPGGKVERVAFDASDDSNFVAGLRALLTGVEVGVPPPDMLQPLQLRLSLRPKDEQAGGK